MPVGETTAGYHEMMCIHAHTSYFGCSTNVLRRVYGPVSLTRETAHVYQAPPFSLPAGP
jgi:hypothetical protein